ncbi:MAG: hypothetical protein EPO26_04400 [Chloroflexota bacterium]|nr:MAG: hypothetical protein EPO26_04400 [Chloroflexota bacterium]
MMRFGHLPHVSCDAPNPDRKLDSLALNGEWAPLFVVLDGVDDDAFLDDDWPDLGPIVDVMVS